MGGMRRMGRMGYKKWVSGATTTLPVPIALFPSYPSHPSFPFPFTHKKTGGPALRRAARFSFIGGSGCAYGTCAGMVMGVALSE